MKTSRLLSPVIALVLCLLALPCLTGLVPGLGQGPPHRLGEVPVLSQPSLYGPGLWHSAPEGKTWYGAYRTFPDTFAYCIDAGKQSPRPRYFEDAKARTLTAPQTAWALHTYAASDSPDVQAALSAIARAEKALDHDHTVPPRDLDELGRKFAGAAKQYRSITAEAKKLSGPYTLELSLTQVIDLPDLEPYSRPGPGQHPPIPDPPPSLPVPNDPGPNDPVPGDPDPGSPAFPLSDELSLRASLVSASGAQVPDVPITLTISGADGPATVTSGTEPVITTLSAEGPGTVSVSASATVAPETVKLYEPTSGSRVQRVITPDEPTTVTGEASLDLTSAPRVTTEISESSPQPGETLTDTFTVAGLLGEHTVTVVHELWSTASRPELGTKNDDARVIGTVTSTNVGNGTHTSGGIRLPDDVRGWVYFTETIAADEETKEWTGLHGQPDETGFVPWTPNATTQASIEGGRVVDEVAVSGLRPGAEARLTVTAYRTEEEPTRSKDVSGTELASQDLTVVGDQEGTATVRTDAIDLPVGWVTFVTTIHADDVHRGWTSDWGEPSETVHRPPEEKPSAPPSPAPPSPPSPTPPESPAPEPSATARPPAPPAPHPPTTRPAAPVAGELPRTGAGDTLMPVGIGLVLIGTGGAVLLLTGRRRRE